MTSIQRVQSHRFLVDGIEFEMRSITRNTQNLRQLTTQTMRFAIQLR